MHLLIECFALILRIKERISAMNKVRVTICGKEFALKTEESASYFYALAKKVEKTIDEMIAQSDSISVQSAAILAALSAFDEAQRANESIDNIRTQVKEYVDEACAARAEKEDALKKIQTLELRVKELENELKVSEMKETIDKSVNKK